MNILKFKELNIIKTLKQNHFFNIFPQNLKGEQKFFF